MTRSIDQAIGSTPMVELTKLDVPDGVRLFAKLEFTNPGRSIKDRIVRYILDQAEQKGDLKPGATIIENTSGNTGSAIAMLSARRGYKAILTMPDKVSREKQDILRALNAEVVVCPTSAPPDSPEHYVAVARRLHKETPGSFMLNQYDNPLNAEAHYLTSGPEIWAQMNGDITAFVSSGSTGGTISGVGRFLKSRDPRIKVVLLDPVGSIYYRYFHDGVVDSNEIGSYYVEGVGEDHLAKCMDFSTIDDVCRFDDASAFSMCRMLAEKEGLLCGGTSGANVWGAIEVARSLHKPSTIVTVLPDSGANYVSKIYNDDWMTEHGFEFGSLTLGPTGLRQCDQKRYPHTQSEQGYSRSGSASGLR